jgi:hypothetical protein
MRDPRKRTGAERTEIWDRVSSGEPIPSIASSFGRYPSAIRSLQWPREVWVQQSVTKLSVPRARHDRCLTSPRHQAKVLNICNIFHENHV